MNLPENLSPAAIKVYNLLSAQSTDQSVDQLSKAYTGADNPEGHPQAIATANSLLVKGIINKENEGGETVYSLLKPPVQVNPDEEFTGDGYVEGEGETENSDANAEEQRMVDLLNKNGKKLPESKLFELYGNEQLPNGGGALSDNTKEIEDALQQLTDAGAVRKNGDVYSIKQ